MVGCVVPFDAPLPPTKLIGALEKHNAPYGISRAKLSGSKQRSLRSIPPRVRRGSSWE